MTECLRCHGEGVIWSVYGQLDTMDKCPRCKGTGEDTRCSCGHPVERCAPERCSHPFARDAMWGDS